MASAVPRKGGEEFTPVHGRSEHRNHASFRRRLRWGTALAGVVVFVVPFGLFYLILGYASKGYLESQTYARLNSAATTNARLLEDVIEVRRAEIESLAQSLSQLPPGNSRETTLRAFARGSPWYSLLGVADGEGNLLMASEELHGRLDDIAYFRQALAGQTLVTDVFLSPLRGKPETLVLAPLGSPAGGEGRVLVAALRLEKLRSRLLEWGLGTTGEAALVTRAGLRVASSHPEGKTWTPAFEIARPPFEGPTGAGRYRDAQGRSVLCAYNQLDDKNLYFAALVAESEVLARASELRSSILVYLAPFLALGVLLAVLTWHYVVSYILRLTDEIYQALETARQRERERDLAHQELARRFEEERELARQKAQFQTQLADYEKSAALVQLALGAAHEINNPLLGILSHLELELKAAGTTEEREEIQQCIEAAKRISSTLHGLLNYARPGPLHLSKINLDRLISEALEFLQRQPLFRSKHLEKKVAADLPAIAADANQISQVLMNLLLNAGDATPEGGTITVAAEPAEGGKVAIRVSDTGCGIPADVLPYVFDPFITTKRGSGTGLGLSISRAYVRSHHGEISIDSAPGRGTSVQLTLPVEQEGQSVPEAPEVLVE